MLRNAKVKLPNTSENQHLMNSVTATLTGDVVSISGGKGHISTDKNYYLMNSATIKLNRNISRISVAKG